MTLSIQRLFLSCCFCVLTACSTTPKPTGDRIVSVSWVNPSPTPYRYIRTEVCGKEHSLTVEDLAPYSEEAQALGIDLVGNCKVSLLPVVGTKTLPRQASLIVPPRISTPTREYHLKIRVHPTLPPQLTLEPIPVARQRLEEAGRPWPETSF